MFLRINAAPRYMFPVLCVVALVLIHIRIGTARSGGLSSGLSTASSARKFRPHRAVQTTQLHSQKLMAGIQLTPGEESEWRVVSTMITETMHTKLCRRFVAREPARPAVCCKVPNERSRTNYAVCVLEELLDTSQTARWYREGNTTYVNLFDVRQTIRDVADIYTRL